MVVSSRMQLIDVQKMFNDLGMGPEDRRKEFSKFARQEIELADNHNTKVAGIQLPRREFVDGVEGKPLANVREGGKVVATWEFGEEIVRWVYETLRDRAPALKGVYRDSISIFADEVKVVSPVEARGAQQVVIVATVPYARKLEGTGGDYYTDKYTSSQAPDGVFNVVAAAARKKFRSSAKIHFTYRGITGGNTMMQAWASGKMMSGRRRSGRVAANRQFQKDVRNPAILIIFK